DLAAYEALARQAQALGKTVVALKVGKSAQARAATISHTASLAGDEAGAQAFLDRLGFLRAETLPCFLETLKLLHVTGRLPNTRIATISCSGGEASLAADTAEGLALEFPPLNERQKTDLRTALGPMVSLANPLDYHTYIWRDTQAMTRCFAAMMDPSLAMTLLIVDFPRSDRCSAKDWDCAISATIAAKHRTGANVGMVATLPELMPEDVADRLLAEAVVPFHGLTEALIACAAASRQAVDHPPAVLKPKSSGTRPAHQLSEAQAKAALATYGLRLPGFHRVTSADDAAEMAEKLGFPVVLKGEGIAHKTEAGAVRLNLPDSDSVRRAAQGIGTSSFLVEEMVRNSVAELLIGVVCDPAHGFVMTLAAGGILTEVLEDRASFLLPATDEMIEQALSSLRVFRLLAGYRGQPPADHGAILRAVRSVEAYVIGEHFGLQEVEVNPLVCTTSDAIAVDALICRAS
ncbi:MAG: acetate--CoA ligase family protein, partial [Pseudomonadota bacterium]